MKHYLPKILITGGSGQLAHALRDYSLAMQCKISTYSRNEFDITRTSAIEAFINLHKPDIIINTAAYTAVDKAEQEREAANLVNHIGAQRLAIACKRHHIPIIHLSTDYVFDGMQSHPYHEDTPANPINVYGHSKWLGEEAIRQECTQYIILRVSGIYSDTGNNFVHSIRKLAQHTDELRVVADQITCPTHARDIAHAIFTLANNLKHFGTYHFCSNEPVSWYHFAQAIISGVSIKAISSSEYCSAAKRPAYSVLNCDKIAKDYGIKQPNWRKDFP